MFVALGQLEDVGEAHRGADRHHEIFGGEGDEEFLDDELRSGGQGAKRQPGHDQDQPHVHAPEGGEYGDKT